MKQHKNKWSWCGNNFPCRCASSVLHVSSHGLRCWPVAICFQQIVCFHGVLLVCLLQPQLLFILEMLMRLPVVTVFYLCFCFVSKFAFAWVLSARKSSKAWSHASSSIQRLLCKMLNWKSKCGIYVQINKHLMARACTYRYCDTAIWHLAFPHASNWDSVCCPCLWNTLFIL